MTKRTTRITGILLALVLVLSGVFVISTSAAAASDLSVTIDTTASITLKDADADGFYDIGTADELYAFAAAVNGGSNDINVELTADIVINENVLTEGGTLNGDGSSFRKWITVGTSDNRYNGSFNGNRYTISGVYVNDNDSTAIFRYVDADGVIENLGLMDSYIKGSKVVGGLVCVNYGTVENCFSTATVEGVRDPSFANYFAGFVGGNKGNIQNCYFAGRIVLTTGCSIGAISGYNDDGATVSNCYFDNTLFSGDAAAQVDSTATVTNTEGRPAADFESGAICELVGFHNAEECVCTVCGGDAHTPAERTDCTEDLVCAIDDCQAIIEKGNTAHTPSTRTDCTEDLICAIDDCRAIIAKGNTAHSPSTRTDCTKPLKCINEGCEHIILEGNEAHNAGNNKQTDCLVGVVCTNAGCNEYVHAAQTAHTPASAQTDCTKDVMCSYGDCEQVAIAKRDAHTDPGDDGNCSTAIVCSTTAECEHVLLAAVEHSFDENGFCINLEGACLEFEAPALVTEENYESYGLSEDYVGYYAIKNNGNFYYAAKNMASNQKFVFINDITVDNSVHAYEPRGAQSITIDGNGKTLNVSIDYSDETREEVGLFMDIDHSTIKNLVLRGSIVAKASIYLGGIGANGYRTTLDGVISYLDVTNTYEGGGYTGGFFGVYGGNPSDTEVAIKNSAVIATISGYRAGGMVGRDYGNTNVLTIKNSYFIGNLKGNSSVGIGAFVATIVNTDKAKPNNFHNLFWISDPGVGVFYNNSTVAQSVSGCYCIGGADTSAETVVLTEDQAESGELAFLLNGSKNAGVWGQLIGTDAYPVPGGVAVYATVGGRYTNTEPATTTDTPEFKDGYYIIDSASDLIWFRDFVNSGVQIASADTSEDETDDLYSPSANAKLAANIDLGGMIWTPIKSTALYYKAYGDDDGYLGIFDGQGFVISNYKLYSNNASDSSYGLFGTVSGTVKNLGIDNAYFANAGYDFRVGAIVGQLIKTGLIENCYVVNSSINAQNGAEHVAGGIAGSVYEGTVKSSFVINSKVGGGRYGYIVGDSAADEGSGSEKARAGKIIDCYTDVYPAYGTTQAKNVGDITNSGALPIGAFATGEAVYLLNGSINDGFWSQGAGYPDFYGEPVFKNYCGESGYFFSADDIDYDEHEYQDGECIRCYAVEEKATLILVTEENYGELGLDESYVGYYAIATADELFAFAEYVNGGEAEALVAKMVLLADIDLGGEDWTPIGHATEAPFKGVVDGNGHSVKGMHIYADRNDRGFVGYITEGVVKNITVYGEILIDSNLMSIYSVGGVVGYARNKTVIENVASYVDISVIRYEHAVEAVGGVVGWTRDVSGGGAQEVIVDGASFYGSIKNPFKVNHTGGIVGRVNGDATDSNSTVTVRNSANYGTIFVGEDGMQIAGIVGFVNQKGYIENCINAAYVNAANSTYVGGILGYVNNSYFRGIARCINVGEIAGADAVGQIVGYFYAQDNVIADNLYLNGSVGDIGRSGGSAVKNLPVTTDDLTSGKAAFILNGPIYSENNAWGQEIGVDAYPVLGGALVYGGREVCGAGFTLFSNTPIEGGFGHSYDTGSGICDCGAYEPAVWNSEDGLYEISNAGQFLWYAALVNGTLTEEVEQNAKVGARLNADLDLTAYGNDVVIGRVRYEGEFDGNGKTVTVSLTNEESLALFKFVENAYIHDLTVEGTVNVNFKFASGLVSEAYGETVIERCISKVSIISSVNGDGTHGGLIAYTDGRLELRDSAFVGSINGENTTHVAGLIGYVAGEAVIEDCFVYATYTVGASNSNSIARKNSSARLYVRNVYYFNAVGDTVYGAQQMSAEDFASGKVAYALGANWGQNIVTQSYPALGGAKIYAGYAGDATCGDGYSVFANISEGLNTEIPNHSFVEGACECGAIEAPELVDGYYQITSVKDLIWFAELVASGNTNINATLMNDITVDEDEMTDGFIGIGTASYYYSGHFNGNGNTLTIDLVGDENAALFPFVDGATIENLTVDGNVESNGKFAAGLISEAIGKVTINRVYLSVYLDLNISGDATAGGFIGVANGEIIITESAYFGMFLGSGTHIAGFIGWNNDYVTIRNSYAYYMWSGDTNNDFIARGNADKVTLEKVYVYAFAGGEENFGNNVCGAETASGYDLISGRLAYLLGGIWGQNIKIDAADTEYDSVPVLDPDGEKKVYSGYAADAGCADGDIIYVNDESLVKAELPVHVYENGICECNAFEPAELVEGYYEIENVGQLFWFATLVNEEKQSTASARLMADLDLAGLTWTPIGYYTDTYPDTQNNNPYKGTFDGNFHVIKNLVIVTDDTRETGFFSRTQNAVIKNLGIENATVESAESIRAGVIVGEANKTLIENCFVIGTITITIDEALTNRAQIGAIAGEAADARIVNCFTSYGILVTDTEASDPEIVNGFYLANEANAKSLGENKNTTQFNLGEVAYLLGESFGQQFGKNQYPVFGGAKVYAVYPDNATCYSVPDHYTNDVAQSNAKPGHDYDDCLDAVCNNENCNAVRVAATKHSFVDCLDSDCDNENCDYVREAADAHVYDGCFDTECNNEGCRVMKNIEDNDHSFTNSHDGDCNNAGCTFRRTTSHTPGDAADCENAQTCTICGDELAPALGHTAGAAATCTVAQSCTVCGDKLTPALGHTAGAAATCTTAQSCTVCNEILETALGHTPGAAATCTAAQTCTVCQTELAAALGHKYDNDCDADCNTCQAQRTPAAHSDGDEDYKCDACGAELPKKGLSGGAIAGIVIGSTVVVGLGGFSLVWFVIKKKSLAQLLVVFKKKK